MLIRFLPRWPVMFDLRLADVRASFRRAPLRRVRRRVRPDLIMLEDRVTPAAPAMPLVSVIGASDPPILVAMRIDNPNPPVLGIPAADASPATLSTNDPVSFVDPMLTTDPLPLTIQSEATGGSASGGVTGEESRRIKIVTDSPDAANSAVNNSNSSTADLKGDKATDNAEKQTDGSRPDKVVAAGRLKLKQQKHQNDDSGGGHAGEHLVVKSIRSFLVPLRVVADAVATTVNVVTVPERAAPSTVTTATPAAAAAPATATTATAASGAPQPVLLGPDVIAAATPVATPVAVPGSTGAFALTQSAAGVVLANFASAALTLPRTGGDTPTSDVGFRSLPPSTGMPMDGSTTPGRPAPLPTAGSGAGVVTEELPDATLPPIELVPPVSDQTPPVAPIESGISGTAVLVATVAAAGLLAGTYYSQFRRSGRGPRLRVQG